MCNIIYCGEIILCRTTLKQSWKHFLSQLLPEKGKMSFSGNSCDKKCFQLKISITLKILNALQLSGHAA